MSNTVNRKYFQKFRDIFSKIGRKKHKDDPVKVILYIALTEYIEAIETEIMQEPAFIIEAGMCIDENHNKALLEISKQIRDLLDKSLQLSLWDKEVGKEAEAKVRTFFR